MLVKAFSVLSSVYTVEGDLESKSVRGMSFGFVSGSLVCDSPSVWNAWVSRIV